MKKRYLLTAVIALLSVMATSAQTLTITTSSGSKQFSASDITSSSPATFTSNGTRMSISGNTYTVSDIISALVACENHGYVKETCSECGGDTHCTRCHGTGKGCTTCNGTGKYCSECGGSGKCPNNCAGGKCKNCLGSREQDCSLCYGHGTCPICWGDYKLLPNCSGCHGTNICKYCGGTRKEKCLECTNGNCRVCNGTYKCKKCSGQPQCGTCGGDGHCAKCKNSDGKCSNCTGLGYNWVDIILSDKSLDFSYLGESKSLSITLNQSWKATCSATWITLKDAEGKNSGKITITADANPLEDSRTATLIISYGGKNKYVSITQESTPTIKLSEKDLYLGAVYQRTKTISVDCNRNWRASSNWDWLSVSAENQNGGSYLKVTAEENPTMDARYATVTFYYADKKESVNITQAAGEGQFDFSIPTTSCIRDGGYLTLKVEASDRREWKVTRPADATWLHLDTSQNSSQTYNGKGNKTLRIYIDKSTEILARYCQLSIESGSYSKNLTITQDAAPMALYDMISRPFGFINVNLETATYNSVYDVLSKLFELTMYSNAFYVEVNKNVVLSGISYSGLPLSLFSCSKTFSGGVIFRYRFDVDKSIVSNIDPYVKSIYKDFNNIGVTRFNRYDYYKYYVYSANYENVTFEFYVYTESTYYRIDISVEYK